MDDLISRSALIEEINKLMKSPYAEHREPLTGMQVRKEAIQLVQHLCVETAPTAYNVDAVVAELEEKQIEINGNTSLHYLYSEGYSDAIDYLIDIVRNGGAE